MERWGGGAARGWIKGKNLASKILGQLLLGGVVRASPVPDNIPKPLRQGTMHSGRELVEERKA